MKLSEFVQGMAGFSASEAVRFKPMVEASFARFEASNDHLEKSKELFKAVGLSVLAITFGSNALGFNFVSEFLNKRGV